MSGLLLLAPPDAIEVIDTARCAVGECPLWDHRDGSMYWIDVRGPAVHRLATNGRKSTWTLDAQVGSIALARLPSGANGLMLAGYGGFGIFDPSNGTLTPVANPEPDRPDNRLNDGRVDRRGRMWAGSLQPGTFAPRGRLWRINPDYSAHMAIDSLTIPNGIAFSPDNRRLYFTDSATGRIDTCDFDLDDGVISNRRTFVTLATGRGVADGAAIDIDGCLWSAHFNGWCVTRYDPRGHIDRVINLPVRCVTSCGFGGAALDTLYITTGAVHLSAAERAQQPLAGCLLAVRVPATGVAETEFGSESR
ncbi:MAG: SMP-30/gluconolactonase/LRE family protein [Burkholderiales bacterium]